jgi:hypothetical protein
MFLLTFCLRLPRRNDTKLNNIHSHIFFINTVLQYTAQLNFADNREAKESHRGWSGEKLINMHGISGSTVQVGLYCALQDAPGYETLLA